MALILFYLNKNSCGQDIDDTKNLVLSVLTRPIRLTGLKNIYILLDLKFV